MCAFCGKINRNFLCEECNSKIKTLEQFHIDKYNINTNKYYEHAKSEENLYLYADKINYKYYDEHIYLFKYEGIIREKIIDYKFNDKAYYYKSFVKILLNNKKICEILKSYDIIIPVPIHNKRRRERGYNQTELISRELSKFILSQEENNIILKNNFNANKEKKIDLKYVEALIKTINTKPQSMLNKEQRLENAKDVYELKTQKTYQLEYLNKKRILIFDDIYTTGSTANECAKVLKRLKPEKIGILTIAKD